MALQPYETLCRWKDDGSFSGGHTLRRDDLTGRVSDPQPLGSDSTFPWSDVAVEINTGTLAQVADLTAQLATATQAAADAKTASTAAESLTTQRDATITQLQAQIAALTAPAPESSVLAQLDAALAAALTPEQRQGFAPEILMVRYAVQQGMPEEARAVICNTPVTPDLETAKVQLLALLS